MKNYTPETLAKEIREAVDYLREADCGCVTIKLNGTLTVCVGWSNGFDPDDPSVIHSKTQPTYAIVAAIKAWGSDDMRTDFDYINMPYYDDGETLDTSCSIEPGEDYLSLARYFLEEFDMMKDLDIDIDGRIK